MAAVCSHRMITNQRLKRLKLRPSSTIIIFSKRFLEFYLLFSIAYFYSHNRHNRSGVLSSSRRTFKHREHKKIQVHQPKHQMRHFCRGITHFFAKFLQAKIMRRRTKMTNMRYVIDVKPKVITCVVVFLVSDVNRRGYHNDCSERSPTSTGTST